MQNYLKNNGVKIEKNHYLIKLSTIFLPIDVGKETPVHILNMIHTLTFSLSRNSKISIQSAKNNSKLESVIHSTDFSSGQQENDY